MLSAKALLAENLPTSPFTKRRPQEGLVIYHLLVNGTEDFSRIVGLLENHEVAAIDINLGCPAPEIRPTGGGISLFYDFSRLQNVLQDMRQAWHGPLSVKCRLGKNTPDWKESFAQRMKLFEDSGVDAVAVHPRFEDEKLKRRARWELLPWIASLTALPLIANGDIARRADIESHADWFAPVRGIMMGRMAVLQPWVFATFGGTNPAVDHREVWERHFRYVTEDFPPEKAVGRVKEFTAWFARSFFFGHDLFAAAQSAPTLDTLYDRAVRFLEAAPRLTRDPSPASGI